MPSPPTAWLAESSQKRLTRRGCTGVLFLFTSLTRASMKRKNNRGILKLSVSDFLRCPRLRPNRLAETSETRCTEVLFLFTSFTRVSMKRKSKKTKNKSWYYLVSSLTFTENTTLLTPSSSSKCSLLFIMCSNPI